MNQLNRLRRWIRRALSCWERSLGQADQGHFPGVAMQPVRRERQEAGA